MTIGELARRTGCGIETIRYYEHEGLLPKPGRTSGNFRHFGQEHDDLLSFIRRCRSLDMALTEVRTLLRFRAAPEENCGEVNSLLDRHIGHVEDRIAELRNLKRQLRSLRDKCEIAKQAQHCGVLKGLRRPANTSHAPRANHVPRTHSTK